MFPVFECEARQWTIFIPNKVKNKCYSAEYDYALPRLKRDGI